MRINAGSHTVRERFTMSAMLNTDASAKNPAVRTEGGSRCHVFQPEGTIASD